MTYELKSRLFFSLILSFIFAFDVYKRHRANPKKEDLEDNQLVYSSYISGYLLPMAIVILFAISLAFDGFHETTETMLSFLFGNFVHIGIYYMILLPALPLLRKYISARACAVLWIIPNYLYVTVRSYMDLPTPLLVVRAPEHLIWTLFYIWLVGFLGILGWNIVSHLRFRHQILNASILVTDPEILEVWNNEIEQANIKKPKFQLVISPNAATPVSVGLFRRTIRVILPEQNYTPEELSLIFRHEIIHISREDAWSKFFLLFCTAMLWFNPFMWVTMRKCSDDLELSCDETVLLGCDNDTRRQYAELILNTAGEERGFTTCLSASATALRYRLQNIVKPRKKYSGALIVGLTFFLLTTTSGYISLAYNSHTGSELIYQSRDSALCTLSHIAVTEDPYQTTYDCLDHDALYMYLSNLTLEEITGDYTYSDSDRQMTILYDTPDGVMGITLYDEAVKISPIYNKGTGTKYYYLPDGTDWEYLDAIIFAYPALNFKINTSETTYNQNIQASLWNLKKTESGIATVLYETTHPEATPSGMFGYNPTEVALDFSYDLASAFTVKVETWDRQSSYTISETELEQPHLFPLAPYPAHYTIYAEFTGENGSIYEAEFRFDFGDVNKET